MYTSNHRVDVVPNGFEDLSEGKARPGHFRGVATVVSKLFNLIQPTRAYFGQKDAMQCVVIKRLIEDLNFNTKLVIAPTEREAAPAVYASLTALATKYNEGERKVDALCA